MAVIFREITTLAAISVSAVCRLVVDVAGGNRWTFVTTNLDVLLPEPYVAVLEIEATHQPHAAIPSRELR
jgi:hypothetical protein